MASGRGGGTGAGRPKGGLNQRTKEFLERLDAACKKHNVDLVEAQVMLTKSEDEDVRQRALSAIYRHAFPALKAIEHTGEVETAPQGFRLVVVREGDSVVTPGVDSSTEPATDPLS